MYKVRQSSFNVERVIAVEEKGKIGDWPPSSHHGAIGAGLILYSETMNK